jgi:hypothetical protein
MGTADDHCAATHNYEQPKQEKNDYGKNRIYQIPEIGQSAV